MLYYEFVKFKDTLYSDANSACGPKLLQISLRHRSRPVIDLLLFVKFRIAPPNTEFQFVADEVMNSQNAHEYDYLDEFNRIANNDHERFKEYVNQGFITDLRGRRQIGGDVWLILPDSSSLKISKFIGKSNESRWRDFFEKLGVRFSEFTPWLVFQRKTVDQ